MPDRSVIQLLKDTLLPDMLVDLTSNQQKNKATIFYLRIYTDAVAAYSFFIAKKYDQMMKYTKKMEKDSKEPPGKTEKRYVDKIRKHIFVLMETKNKRRIEKDSHLIKNTMKTIQGICILRIISS